MTRILDHRRLELKSAGTERAIVAVRGGTRILSCGHTVPVPRGGRVHLATAARCRKCLELELQTVPKGTVRTVESPDRLR